VLTERLRHLLAHRQWETESVVAVAYNVRARAEMEARTTDLGARIVTLNALAYQVLAEALPRRPDVIEERAVRALLDDLLPRRGRPRLNTDPMAPYLEALTEIRLGLRDPALVEASRPDVPGLADAFGRYRAALADRGAVDFDEQVYRAVELLVADGPLRQRLQARHRHLLVDELQDLTPAHVLLVRLLSAPRFDVFGVGDDDQVIYGHAGADPRFLIDYRHYFPGAHHHALEVNYRCPERVVTAATNLLSRNRIRVPKTIHPGPHAPTGDDRLQIRRHGSHEAGPALVDTVTSWLATEAAPADVAVLVRVNASRLGPVVALREAGVPVADALPPDLLHRLGLRAALAWLRSALDPDRISGADLTEIRRRPSKGFPGWIDKWLERCSSADDVAKAAGAIDDVRVSEKLAALAADIDRLADRAAGGATTRDLLEAIRDDIGLGTAVATLDTSKGAAAASHLDDLDALLSVADLHPDPEGFEPWLRAHVDRRPDPDGVTVSTIHRVKGQEWPHIAVFAANDGLLPHRLSSSEHEREEERRVFHVAITRGRHHVVVLADETRPSPFLDELAAPGEPPPPPEPAALAPSPLAPAPDDADHALFESLRSWRVNRARDDGVPAYVVAHDATLREVARRRPTTIAGLSHCHGMGPMKLERYGDDILAIVARA
jgi:DNA helicase-2/ATP-dependent DNA helicase PcrA